MQIAERIEALSQQSGIEITKHSPYLFEINSNTAELARSSVYNKTAVVISGPPGGGKDTLVDIFVSRQHSHGLSFGRPKTATTRPPRESEIGNDPYLRYEMLDFIKADLKGVFLESNLHHDNYYGSVVSEFERVWEEGNHPIIRVDPNGAMNMRQKWLDGKRPFSDVNLVYFYVTAPTLSDLRFRLEQREIQDGKSEYDAQRAVADRWRQVLSDLKGMQDAHFIVLNPNNEVEQAVEAINGVLHRFSTAPKAA